ncbi:hypothetical protein [Sodaliphilus pleomorphus]|uniref:Uncharacterized protein n=1 Tax=Sodaliphilus pleomorphus TaxID=2606626 RepID=A0A6L5XFP0_9BACT|nr:hypothetical protein [Sodaliphilus pleomorphus]MSS18316.1 hypothetical protein [Sodaliphilus pleomorphus]
MSDSEKFERLCTEQEGLYRAEFEQVFAALFAADERQRVIYKTAFWDGTEELPASPDTAKIAEAINNAGFAGNEALCKDFTRYCEIVLEGKRLQQSYLAELTSQATPTDEPPRLQQGEGWRFMNFSIIAPQELHQAITSELDRQAVKGVGLWANETEPSDDDEGLDEFMCVEAYNVQCSNQPFYSDLKNYGITPRLLNKELTRLLFALLKSMGDDIKSNTAEPHKVKFKIIERLRGLDDVPIWGLLFQILLLQGLCKMLECCTLTESDTGYQDAVLLYEWLQERLSEKLISFTFKPWGKGDRERLKPLTDYLYSTEVGRLVQNTFFGVHRLADDEPATADQPQGNQPPASQEPATGRELPSELDTEQAREYFARAVVAGLMSEQYKWLASQSLLACFCREMSVNLDLGKGYSSEGQKRLSWKPFEALFNVKAKNLTTSLNDIKKTGQDPIGIEKVEAIFKD